MSITTQNKSFFQCAAADTAAELFEEMEKLSIAPDRITFTALVSATTAAGQWEVAQGFIDKMQVSLVLAF